MSGVLLAAVGNSYGYKPINTVAPAITGTAQARQTLTCSTGTWDAAPLPITYSYQWKKNGSNISGATNSTYVVASADVGSTIKCTVTATNAVGATSADSNTTATVVANVPTAPTIGTATATSATTATVAFTASSDNGGATITSYTAVSVPGGFTGTGASSPITVSGLSANTNYYFYVYATNSVGNSANSGNSNTITTPEAYYLKYLPGTISGSGGDFQSIQIDSSNNTYYGYSGGYVDGLFAFTSSNTISWQKSVDAPSQARYGVSYLRGTGNVFFPCTYDSGSVAVIGTGGSKTWERKWTYSGQIVQPIRGAQNSSGEYWLACNRSSANTTLHVLRVNSSGNYTHEAPNMISGTGFNVFDAIFDSSNRYYVTGKLDGTVDAGYAVRLSSTGSGASADGGGLWYVRTSTGTTSSRSGRITCIVENGSNLIMTGFTYDDSSGYRHFVMSVAQSDFTTVNWANYFSFSVSNSEEAKLAVDSSGNIYYVLQLRSSPVGELFIARITSGGSLSWQRYLTAPTDLGYQSYPDISVSPSGSHYMVASRFSANDTFIFKAPKDGSKTGSFSGPGGTWSYSGGGAGYGTWSTYTWARIQDVQSLSGNTNSAETTTTVFNLPNTSVTPVDYNY